MRYLRGLAALACLAVGAMLLTACGSTFAEKAYKTGQAYELSQQAAIGYMEVAKPSADVADKINAADDKAAPMVTQLLQCARDIVAAEEAPPPAEAAQLGLDSGDVAEAKEEACEGLLSRATRAIQALDDAVASS